MLLQTLQDFILMIIHQESCVHIYLIVFLWLETLCVKGYFLNINSKQCRSWAASMSIQSLLLEKAELLFWVDQTSVCPTT